MMVRTSHQLIMINAISETIMVTAVINDISMRRSCQTIERSPGRSASQAKPKPRPRTSMTKNNNRIIMALLIGRGCGSGGHPGWSHDGGNQLLDARPRGQRL